MRNVIISHQPIELFKLLKFEGLVASGGDAKTVISDGLVSVNGTVETQKRKKIVSGDRVTFGGESLVVQFVAEGTAVPPVAAGEGQTAPKTPVRQGRRSKPPIKHSK